MKKYQKPNAEFVVLTSAEEIAASVKPPGMEGDVVSNPFANLITD